MAETIDVLRPTSEEEVREAVADALATETPLEIMGGGSKRPLGRAIPSMRRLEVAGLAGVSLYEPEELVLTAKAGTKLAEIEALLAESNQQLAFEPPDWRALLGTEGTEPTLGGTIACNMSGSRRIKAGAARDHVLGVRVVSGRGEVFKSGGRVVKNVTGYDMAKLMTGSYGTLGVMTEITVKVLPAAEKVRTLLLAGLDDEGGLAALTRVLQSPNDVSGAAHLTAPLAARSAVSYVREVGSSVTAIRVEGTEPSVEARCTALRGELGGAGEIEELHRHNSAAFWREVGSAAPFAEDRAGDVWRLSVPPASGAAVVEAVRREISCEAYYDWGGGLIWIALADEAERAPGIIRAAIAERGGHATLIRASEARRARVAVFQPQAAPVAALSRRVKEAFDPAGILNPGRMAEGM